MRTQVVSACLVLAWATGCAGSGTHPTTLASEPPASPTPKASLPGTSPDLVVRVTPRSGPVGTSVQVTATGCLNAGAVSFNNDANDMSARNDPNTVHAVAVSAADDHVTGTYVVTRRDLTGGEGLFYVQCGQTLGEAPFLVTGPVAANGACPLHAEKVVAADAPAAFDAVVAYATALDPKLSPDRIRKDSVRLASTDLHGRGGQVHCGDVDARTFVVSTTRTDMLPSASLSEGVYFVSRVAGRMWVWQQAH